MKATFTKRALLATSLGVSFLAACSAGDQGSASNSSAAATAGEQGASGDLRTGAAQGPSTEFATGAIARSGQTIDINHTLTSANGHYELTPDVDEWYVVEKQAPSGKRILFGKKDKSYNKDTTWAVMQGDGNVVFLPYRPQGNARPPSTVLGTSQTEYDSGSYLTMQDNGNVTVRRPKRDGEEKDPVIWSWFDRCPTSSCYPSGASADYLSTHPDDGPDVGPTPPPLTVAARDGDCNKPNTICPVSQTCTSDNLWTDHGSAHPGMHCHD